MNLRAVGNGKKGNDKIAMDFVLTGQHYPAFDILQFEFPDPPAGMGYPYYGTGYHYHLSYDVSGKSYADVYEHSTDFRLDFGDTSNAFRGGFRSFFSLQDRLVKFEAFDTTQHVVYYLRRSHILRE
jgi:hypothetical protein